MSSSPRRPVRPGPAHLAGAAVLVLLAGCGGGSVSGDSSAGSSAAATKTAATSSAGASAGAADFCARAADLDQRVDAAVSDTAGGDASVADVLHQLGDELRAMEPPDAIADDWNTLAGGVDELATAFGDFDLTDPDTLAALEAAEKKLTTASDHVETYLRDECGIQP